MNENILQWLAEEYKWNIELEWSNTMEDGACITDQQEFEDNAYWHNISDNGSVLCANSYWHKVFNDNDKPTTFKSWNDLLTHITLEEREQLMSEFNNVVDEFLGK